MCIKDPGEVYFLFRSLRLTAFVRRVPTNISFPALILKVNLRLIQWRLEQIIGAVLHAFPRRRADAQPVEPQGVAAGDPVGGFEREELSEGELLALRPAASWSRTPIANTRPAPRLGEHTREVLAEAGLSAAAIDALLAQGAAKACP